MLNSFLYTAGKLFPPLPRSSRQYRSRDNRNNHSSILSCEEFFEKLDALIRTDLHNTFNEIRKMLNIAKKKVLKEIAFQIMERDNFTFHENRFQIYEYILDVIDTEFLKEEEPIKKQSPQKRYQHSVCQ